MKQILNAFLFALSYFSIIPVPTKNLEIKEETYKYVNNSFSNGYIQETGTALARVLPPLSRFSPSGDRTKKRQSVLEKLVNFFNKFCDISDKKLIG